MGLGSRIRKKPVPDPRIQGSKKSGSAKLFVSSFEWYCVCLKDYNLDKLSGLNMSLACRGDYVVKPQVMLH